MKETKESNSNLVRLMKGKHERDGKPGKRTALPEPVAESKQSQSKPKCRTEVEVSKSKSEEEEGAEAGLAGDKETILS